MSNFAYCQPTKLDPSECAILRNYLWRPGIREIPHRFSVVGEYAGAELQTARVT